MPTLGDAVSWGVTVHSRTEAGNQNGPSVSNMRLEGKEIEQKKLVDREELVKGGFS